LSIQLSIFSHVNMPILRVISKEKGFFAISLLL